MRTPRHVFVDLSTACNAACVMCPTQRNPHRKQIMRDETFAKIVREVSPFADTVEAFYFGIHGEPFLDKKLDQKIALCSASGITRTLIATNGSLVSQERARALLAARPWVVVFSLESLSPAVYESIRVGLSHADIVANIKNFIALRNHLDSPCRIAIRFIVSEWNRDEVDDFVAYWRPLLDIERGRWDYFDISRIHNWAYGETGKFYGTSPCPHIEYITILSDGTVSACCLDHEAVHNFGNVNETPLLEIFNGPRAAEFRRVHLARQRNELMLCSTCNIGEVWANPQGGPPEETRFVAAEWPLYRS